MFSTFLTVIFIGYVLYYVYLIVDDLFLKKDAPAVVRAEEEDVDISNEMQQFTSEHIERTALSSHNAATPAETATVVNTGGLEVSDLRRHIDAFARGEAFGELQVMMEDWELDNAA